MPKVSVIIPVYNAEQHLRECLDTVVGQTLSDIEILCVDDGSTDESMSILKEYADKDPRLSVLQQENAGAGAARNNGLRAARGDYLSFLDADDFFELTMLEKAYEKCVSDDADIAVYRATFYDPRARRSVEAEWPLGAESIPDVVPFTPEDVSDRLLALFAPAPWNRLFRRAFVLEKGLEFQEIKRANDLYFTMLALVYATRITIVDEALVYYRVGSATSLQATNHETPLEFYDALLATREHLRGTGTFDTFERSFVNAALIHCLYNLRSLKTHDAFDALYRRLQDEMLHELGIDGREPEYFLLERTYEQYVRIRELSAGEYLFNEDRDLRDRLTRTNNRQKKMTAKLRKADAKLAKIRASRAYLLGQRIDGVLLRIRRTAPTSRKAE